MINSAAISAADPDSNETMHWVETTKGRKSKDNKKDPKGGKTAEDTSEAML